ncbi:Uncharacterised protein [Salmonella enterica subsp. enterica serovar Bovismorbificans]|uniref:Uncharacterized protein n=1 Tax=Salmonella enterica subsp. enterica serovar Bovismorbificans TaxID=58097 RepID=A0A655CY00_SALET|nr:Uncharacterised protein [Salmonella enterica subsp. enterica serovar Bovismorbificans]
MCRGTVVDVANVSIKDQRGVIVCRYHTARYRRGTQINNQLRGAATDAILGDGVGEALFMSVSRRGLSQRVGVTAILINVQRAVLSLDIHATRADRRTDAVGVGDGGDRGARRRGIISHDVAGTDGWPANNTCAGLVYIDIQAGI